jgi:hypothetical protein
MRSPTTNETSESGPSPRPAPREGTSDGSERDLTAGPPRASAARHAAALVAFSIFYFAIALSKAAVKPMMHDELVTWHLARLPGVRDIWDALAVGGDLHPPLSYAASNIAMRLFGDGEVAVRLPAILAFWATCLCLYAFVARRCAIPYALVAALVPLASGAFYYATEARSYALYTAFCAAGLLARQQIGERAGKAAPTVAFAASLALAMSSHYYAALLVVPFGFAEIARARAAGGIRWHVVAAIVVAALSLVLYVPLIKATARYAPDFWARPDLGSVGESYALLLTGLFLPLLLALALCAALRRRRREDGVRRPASARAPADDLVVAAALAAFPVVVVAAAFAAGAGFTDRYALPALVGLSVLVAFAAAAREGGRTGPGLAFVCAFAVVVLYRSGGPALTCARAVAWGGSVAAPSLGWRVDAPDDGLPIVVANPTSYLPLEHYSDPALASRLVYLAAGETPRPYLLEASGDQVLLALEPSSGIAVRPFAEFVDKNRRFYVYERYGSWLVRELLENRARVVLVRREDATLYYVELAGDADAPPGA